MADPPGADNPLPPSEQEVSPENTPNPSTPDLDQAGVPSIGQEVFDMLQDHLENEQRGEEPDQASQRLIQIGRLLRLWRLDQGKTRTDLAALLNMEANLLLCLECGIRLPGDITEDQFRKLQSLLTSAELDRRLERLIQDYLGARQT